jgi:hypothetical protein
VGSSLFGQPRDDVHVLLLLYSSGIAGKFLVLAIVGRAVARRAVFHAVLAAHVSFPLPVS